MPACLFPRCNPPPLLCLPPATVLLAYPPPTHRLLHSFTSTGRLVVTLYWAPPLFRLHSFSLVSIPPASPPWFTLFSLGSFSFFLRSAGHFCPLRAANYSPRPLSSPFRLTLALVSFFLSPRVPPALALGLQRLPRFRAFRRSPGDLFLVTPRLLDTPFSFLPVVSVCPPPPPPPWALHFFFHWTFFPPFAPPPPPQPTLDVSWDGWTFRDYVRTRWASGSLGTCCDLVPHATLVGSFRRLVSASLSWVFSFFVSLSFSNRLFFFAQPSFQLVYAHQPEGHLRPTIFALPSAPFGFFFLPGPSFVLPPLLFFLATVSPKHF